jgi:succinate dehydrogenase / fumarate reductase membrane anchor subunit
MAMVNKLMTDMSLTGNGLRDWLLQRFSAVILGAYFLVLFGFFFTHSHLTFGMLQTYFSTTWVQVFSLLALLSLFLHAWVGVWTVITDYIKPAALRFSIQALVILTLVIYLFWGVEILWRVV